jgi:hypothetical protein
MLLLPLAKGNSWDWGDPLTIGMLAAGVVLLGAFITLERRLKSPLGSTPFGAARGDSIFVEVVLSPLGGSADAPSRSKCGR